MNMRMDFPKKKFSHQGPKSASVLERPGWWGMAPPGGCHFHRSYYWKWNQVVATGEDAVPGLVGWWEPR